MDKVNVGDVYTKTETDATLLGYVSTLTFETNNQGVVQEMELLESRITQTKLGFETVVTRGELEQIEIGAKNYIHNGNFRSGLNWYTTSGTVQVNDITSLSGFDKMFVCFKSNRWIFRSNDYKHHF